MRMTRRGLMAAASASGLAACASGAGHTPPTAPRDVLGDLDGVGVAARIRVGEISTREAVEAAIARAERINPTLNFIATPAYDYGRTRSAAALTGPFAGVPTFVKDLNDLQGVKTMNGSRAFRDNVATRNDVYVQAMLNAGLVPIGKSTTPEFGFTCTTEPLVTGQTKNPYDITRIAGGSSGGAAAAVASGVVPIAHASDGGGSVRIPASICGLVGLKVSRGRDPESPSAAPVSIGVQGCVSRSVRDTAAWFAAMQLRDGPLATTGLVAGPSERRLRIGYSPLSYTAAAPDADVRAALDNVARLCDSLGHRVTETRIAIDGQAFQDAFILYWASGAMQTRDEIARAAPRGTPIENLLEPLTLQLAEHARRAGPQGVGAAIAVLQRTQREYAALFQNYDVILTPTLAKAPLPLGEIAPTLPWEQGFRRVIEYVAYTPLANASGGAAISLPLSVNEAGLPIGSHFMAPVGGEPTLLHLAYELEMARPWAARRPQVWAG